VKFLNYPVAINCYTGDAMTQAYRLTLDDGEGQPAVIAGELSDAEVTTLNRFLVQYEEWFESMPVQEGVPCELTIHVKDGHCDVIAELPSRDALDILFQRLRLFILQNERASFVNVCSILRRQFTDLRLTELIRDQHAVFHNHPEHLSSVLIVNDQKVNQENMLTDWIYGYQYHADDERRERLRRSGIDVQSPTVRHRLVGLLLNKQAPIRNVASLVAVLLGRNPRFDIYGAMLAGAMPQSGR